MNLDVNNINLPSFKVLVIFIISILLSKYLPSSFIYLELTASIITLLLFLLAYSKDYNYANKVIFISLIFLFLFYSHARIANKHISTPTNDNSELVAFAGKVISYPYCRVSITEDSRAKFRQEYLLGVNEVIIRGDKFKKVNWTVLVKSQNRIKALKLGDYIIIHSKAFFVGTVKEFKFDRRKLIPCWQYHFANNRSYNSFDNRFGGFEHFDYGEYLRNIGVDYLSYPFKGSEIRLIPKPELSWIENIAVRVHYFTSSLFNFIEEPNRSLLKGIILGERKGIADYIENDFRQAGISHILSVSGLHTGFIALTLMLFFNLIFFRLPRLTSRMLIAILTSISLIIYVVVVGYRPSVLRAVIMFICGAITVIFDRDKNYLNPLFISAVIVLWINPNWLFTTGFQLSYLATLGIILYFRKIRDWIVDKIGLKIVTELKWIFNSNKALAFLIKWLVNMFVLTVSAQFLIIPILVYRFGGYSIISVISNIFVIFIVQLAVAFGLLLLFMSFSDILLNFLSNVVEYILFILLNMSEFFATISFSYVELDINFAIVLLYYPSIFIFIYYRGIKSWILLVKKRFTKLL